MSLRVFCPRAHMCATPGNRCIGCIFHPGSGPRGWGPTGRVPGFAITVPLVRPRRAEARCSVPGPHPAEKGAVITRPRGAPHTHTHTRAFHPGPRPSPTQTLITISRPVISLGPGGPGGRTENPRWGGGGVTRHRLYSDAQQRSRVQGKPEIRTD